MLQEPMLEKLTALRLLGMVDALKAQEQDPASRELSFLERLDLLDDQSTMDLARESGSGAAAVCRQAEERSLRRRHRLSRLARTGQKRDSSFGAEIGLGDQSRKHLRARTHRGGQELRCLRLGAEGVP